MLLRSVLVLGPAANHLIYGSAILTEPYSCVLNAESLQRLTVGLMYTGQGSMLSL